MPKLDRKLAYKTLVSMGFKRTSSSKSYIGYEKEVIRKSDNQVLLIEVHLFDDTKFDSKNFTKHGTYRVGRMRKVGTNDYEARYGVDPLPTDFYTVNGMIRGIRIQSA